MGGGAVEAVAETWAARIWESVGRYRLPGVAAAVVVNDRVVWSAGFGYADVDARREVRPDTVFRIASISKVFTALGIMVLRDEGLLELDDLVAGHVGEFPNGDPTVRHLLCHGSGLQRETPGDPGWRTGEFLFDDEFRTALLRARVLYGPLERFKYSNLGYNVLGEVITNVSGTPYQKFVEERVIAPLRLTSTTYDHARLPDERLATGYLRRVDQGALERDPRAWERIWGAAGGLCSTVEDLCALASFLAGTREGPVARQTVEHMRRPVVIADDAWSRGHGLGPMLVRDGDRVLVGHAGGLFSFAAWMLASPSSGVGAAVLTNTGDGDPLLPLLKAMIAEASEAFPKRPEPATEPAPGYSAALLGRYWGDGFIATLEWRDAKLQLVPELREGLPPEPSFGITRSEDGTLTFDDGPYAGEGLTVERDAQGRVTGFETCTYYFERV